MACFLLTGREAFGLASLHPADLKHLAGVKGKDLPKLNAKVLQEICATDCAAYDWSCSGCVASLRGLEASPQALPSLHGPGSAADTRCADSD